MFFNDSSYPNKSNKIPFVLIKPTQEIYSQGDPYIAVKTP
jgi:hypothetical protein